VERTQTQENEPKSIFVHFQHKSQSFKQLQAKKGAENLGSFRRKQVFAALPPLTNNVASPLSKNRPDYTQLAPHCPEELSIQNNQSVNTLGVATLFSAFLAGAPEV
jgi:hypothetical protein